MSSFIDLFLQLSRMNENQKAMKIWGTNKTNNIEYRLTKKCSRRRKPTLFWESILSIKNYKTNLSVEEAQGLWKLTSLSYENYKHKIAHKEEKQKAIKSQYTNSKLNQKNTTQIHSSREDKIQINKTRTILNNAGVRTVVRKASVHDMEDEILWRRRQGKTKTLYTWGRGTQVKTIKD